MSKRGSSILPVIIGLLIAFIIVGTAFYFFVEKKQSLTVLSPFGSKSDKTEASTAKTVEDPITGVMYTAQDASSWKDVRPLAVMMDNHVDARPQSGLNSADVVYEIVAEGGITRYLNFFLSTTPTKVGPIRSTREYYLYFVKELGDAMLMHDGYSPQALVDITTWPVRSLFVGGASALTWRENPRNVATEHTEYANGVQLRALGDKLGWSGSRTIQAWKFKDTANVDTSQKCLVAECKLLEIDFWGIKGDYSGMFKYDRATNGYLRYTGFDASGNPIATIDAADNKQVEVKTVIVQIAPEAPLTDEADTVDGKHRLSFGLIGSGKAMVFTDGKEIDATWSKSSIDGRTVLYDTNGNELSYNRGRFWISVVSETDAGQVTY
jgi:hypothetical protein